MEGLPVPCGVDRFFESSDGVRLHFIEAGEGRPLLMLPGWSQSAAMFGFQIRALATERRVIAIDPRGHGDSAKPSHGYNAHRIAADIRELLVALDLREVDMLGHSGGVKYLWAYFELYGADRLRRLIVVDDSPRLIDNPGWSEAARAEIGPMFLSGELDRFALQMLEGGDAFTEAAMRGMFSARFPDDYPDLFRWIVRENLKMPRELAIELLYATSGVDWRGTIKRVHVPALVIGAEGSTHRESVLRWVAAQMPQAELRIWKRDHGGSHFMFLEDPDRFNAELLRFVQNPQPAQQRSVSHA